jgi:Double zinc ribbon
VTALLLGTLLALLALCFVLWPIFTDAGAPLASAPATAARGESPRDVAVAALREIEFDRATGKLSDADYAQLKQSYTALALEAMRRDDRAAAVAEHGISDAEIEALISRAGVTGAPPRTCPTCGPRPEPDAVYCSTCGHYLPGQCADCGATVSQPGARFCDSCGHRLAAA